MARGNGRKNGDGTLAIVIVIIAVYVIISISTGSFNPADWFVSGSGPTAITPETSSIVF